jgi:hypothetical protein
MKLITFKMHCREGGYQEQYIIPKWLEPSKNNLLEPDLCVKLIRQSIHFNLI